jgi:hypothetical protein
MKTNTEEVVSEGKNRKIELKADQVSQEPIDITSIVKIEDVIEENPLNPTPSSSSENCTLTLFYSLLFSILLFLFSLEYKSF